MTTDKAIGERSPLKLEEFFLGQTRAWGMFQDRFGKPRQRFTVEAQGAWDARTQTLTLTEDFVYDDGRTEQRIWSITKTAEGRYRGQTSGLVGLAHIRVNGPQVQLSYRMKVPIGGRDWTLTFDDRMVLQDQDVILNRADVSKMGFRIGTATICFQKEAVARREVPASPMNSVASAAE